MSDIPNPETFPDTTPDTPTPEIEPPATPTEIPDTPDMPDGGGPITDA